MTFHVYGYERGGHPHEVGTADTRDTAREMAEATATATCAAIVIDFVNHRDASIVEMRDGQPAVRHTGPDGPLAQHGEPAAVALLERRAGEAGIKPAELNLLCLHLTGGAVPEPRFLSPAALAEAFGVVALMRSGRIDMHIDGGAVRFVRADGTPVVVTFDATGHPTVIEQRTDRKATR